MGKAGRPKIPLAERRARAMMRFWRDAGETTDGRACWVWRGGLSPYGYGLMSLPSRRRIGAHRYSFMLFHGREIPPGLHVMHACDNRRCVNPNHLSLGTIQDNIADMHSKGRQFKIEQQAAGPLSLDEVERLRVAPVRGFIVAQVGHGFYLLRRGKGNGEPRYQRATRNIGYCATGQSPTSGLASASPRDAGSRHALPHKGLRAVGGGRAVTAAVWVARC